MSLSSLNEICYLAGVSRRPPLRSRRALDEAKGSELLAATGYGIGDELASMLVLLRALAMVHQTNHWATKGETSYGDHLLFGRLYDGVAGEIDAIGERAVGTQGATAVSDVARQAAGVQAVADLLQAPVGGNGKELAAASLAAESAFLEAVDALVASLRKGDGLSRGTDNLLAGVQDKHESHVYLLKQRVGS